MRSFLLGALLVTVVLAVAIVDQDSGLRTWLRLRHDLTQAQARVNRLRLETDDLEARVTALLEDPLAEEGAIREVLGLARPGEVVIRFRADSSARASNVPVPPVRSRR